MTSERSLAPPETGIDRGLRRMVAVSAAIHAAVLAALLVVPQRLGGGQPKLTSYTVELVAPDKLGGTNLVPGAKGKVPEPPRVEPKSPEPPAPPPPKQEASGESKPPLVEPKGEEKPRAAPRPKPEKEGQAIALAKPTQVPTATPRPTAEAVALAAKPQRSPLRPTAASKPAVRMTPQPTPAAVAVARPLDGRAVAARPSNSPSPPGDSVEARERDARIAAAIRRIREQTGTAHGGTGQGEALEGTGGPISVGPGQGAGGQVRGIEYLLYLNQMTARIKQHWAWAGTNRSLKAVVAFSVLENGEIVNVRTIVPSGDPTYDVSVERAVKAASPLPPPPAEYRREFAQVEYTFQPEDIQP